MNKYEWAIEDIYKDLSCFNKDYEKASKLLDFDCFKGKLKEKQTFLSCMKKLEEVSRIIEKLSVYAMMQKDQDAFNSEYDALFDKVSNLGVKLSSNTAFITPELVKIKTSILKDYIADKELSEYDYMLKNILENKKHVLSEESEKILAEASEPLQSFREIFSKIDNADLPLPPFKYKGKTYEQSHGLFGVYMRSFDRAFRKKAFESYYKGYLSLIDVISATYSGNVKKDVFYAKQRRYNSALEKALNGEDVDVKVYKNLLKSVNKALPSLHRYMAIKKKELGVNKMHMYDIYVPTVENADLQLEYDDAYDLVIKGLSVFGKEYTDLLKKAKEERWLSVYEKKGKRSGAYSVAVYDTHPYVLLNYQKTTHDVFTIAHEMGHSIHSYFSNKNQPYAKADYKIFVAEVASTVNEVLLLKYLLKEAKDVKLKKYLLSYLLEMIRTTLFRQTQFAEFEEYSHRCVENGEALTKDDMNKTYADINYKYYGRSVARDKEIAIEWARIPHFYTAFYVYKYSTGIISALAIANRILTEKETAVKDYFKFLSSGSSDNPVELLKIAGVDLTKNQPFEWAFKIFKDTLDEYSKL